MKITKSILSLIAARFRDDSKPKINQSQMAESLGLGKAWASQFMAGKFKNLPDDQAEKLEQFLGIKLRPYIIEHGNVTPLAMAIDKKVQENSKLSAVFAALLELPIMPEMQTETAEINPKWISTQDMTKIGQQIITICFANEDKPGKVARLVLELLSK